MSRRQLQFGFDMLGNKVYAFRGGTAMGDQLVVPIGKEEITEEFERAMAMYVGCGGDGSRLIQFEENGEFVTYEVQLSRVETTRRLRPQTKRFLANPDSSPGEGTLVLSFFLFVVAIVGFFVSRIIELS